MDNTMAAFKYAIENGLQMIEFDVSKLFCFHVIFSLNFNSFWPILIKFNYNWLKNHFNKELLFITDFRSIYKISPFDLSDSID